MARRVRRGAVMLAAAWALCPTGVLAGKVWRVSPDGGGDLVLLAPGTYRGPGNTDLDFGGKAVELRGDPLDPDSRVIDCAGDGPGEHHRAFLFLGGEGPGTRVGGLTVTGGLAPGDKAPAAMGGAVLCVNASPTLADCVFTGNWAHTGGALALQNSRAHVLRCRFEDNTAEVGGAVSIDGGGPVIEGGVFAHNDAARGGAVAVYAATTTLSGVQLHANTATIGGAVSVQGGGLTVIERCLLTGNHASFGGGIHVQRAGVDMRRCTLSGNAAGSGGGVQCGQDGQLRIAASVIVDGRRGIAVAAAKARALDVRCTLIHGNAGGDWAGRVAEFAARQGNLDVAPQLTDPGRGDFRPLPGSACRATDCGVIGALD